MSQVKPTIVSPASAAKAMTSARVSQGRQSLNSRRTARTASCSPLGAGIVIPGRR